MDLIVPVTTAASVGSGWLYCPAELGNHVVVELEARSDPPSDSPLVIVEFSDDGISAAATWEYIPPAIYESYAPRWLVTHSFVRVTIGVTTQQWTKAASIEAPITNADGRPSVNNPALSALGSRFASIAYAGAHGGPEHFNDGDPTVRRYRISNLIDNYLVDWNDSGKRVDVYADGFRAHSGGSPPPKFITGTPVSWDRGTGTVHAVVRVVEGEDPPNAIARVSRWSADNNFRWYVYAPTVTTWKLEIANKQVVWTDIPNIWSTAGLHVLSTARSPAPATWDMWADGVKHSAAGWDVAGLNMPSGTTEFFSNGSVVRLCCVAFMQSRERLSDVEIAALHANPWAWAA